MITLSRIKLKGIVEKIEEVCEHRIKEGENMFYFPHRVVIRESAEITKVGIACDASSKPTKKCDPNSVEINRFTRLVFGLTQSPFILEATLKVNSLIICRIIPK